MKLGRNIGVHASLKLSKYMGPALPPPPVAIDNSLAISEDLGMMGNDSVGDCTCADVGHAVLLLTAMNAGIFVPTTADVLALYSGATGYDPSQTDAQGNNPTDQGASLTDIAKYAMKVGLTGVSKSGKVVHKLHSFMDIPPTNIVLQKQAIALLGSCSYGVSLPKSAMDSFGKSTWSDTTDTDILGGHDIIAVAYDAEGPTFITWGGYQKATWAWVQHYADEAQARIYEDSIDKTLNFDKSANGFNMQQLEADLTAL
jgi:hypothetical protein